MAVYELSSSWHSLEFARLRGKALFSAQLLFKFSPSRRNYTYSKFAKGNFFILTMQFTVTSSKNVVHFNWPDASWRHCCRTAFRQSSLVQNIVLFTEIFRPEYLQLFAYIAAKTIKTAKWSLYYGKRLVLSIFPILSGMRNHAHDFLLPNNMVTPYCFST